MAKKPNSQNDRSESSLTDFEDEDDFDQLISTTDRVLVDFHADWCGPCQVMVPIIDELAAETDTPVVKVDVEQYPQIAARYDISSIPAFLVFDHGSVEERLIGTKEKAELARKIH